MNIENRDTENFAKQEALLANPSFKRFAGTLELYQDILRNTNKDDTRTIRERMRSLYSHDNTQQEDLTPDEAERSANADSIINDILRDCEAGRFSKEKMVSSMFDSDFGDLLLKNFTPKKVGETDERGRVFLSNIVSYDITKGGEIMIIVGSTGIEGQEVILGIKNGILELTKRIQSGEINGNRVVMKSWLLGGKRKNIARHYLGNDLPIGDVPDSDEDLEGLQKIACHFNRRMLRAYLLNGELPEVGEVVMSTDEFVEYINNHIS